MLEVSGGPEHFRRDRVRVYFTETQEGVVCVLSAEGPERLTGTGRTPE